MADNVIAKVMELKSEKDENNKIIEGLGDGKVSKEEESVLKQLKEYAASFKNGTEDFSKVKGLVEDYFNNLIGKNKINIESKDFNTLVKYLVEQLNGITTYAKEQEESVLFNIRSKLEDLKTLIKSEYKEVYKQNRDIGNYSVNEGVIGKLKGQKKWENERERIEKENEINKNNQNDLKTFNERMIEKGIDPNAPLKKKDVGVVMKEYKDLKESSNNKGIFWMDNVGFPQILMLGGGFVYSLSTAMALMNDPSTAPAPALIAGGLYNGFKNSVNPNERVLNIDSKEEFNKFYSVITKEADVTQQFVKGLFTNYQVTVKDNNNKTTTIDQVLPYLPYLGNNIAKGMKGTNREVQVAFNRSLFTKIDFSKLKENFKFIEDKGEKGELKFDDFKNFLNKCGKEDRSQSFINDIENHVKGTDIELSMYKEFYQFIKLLKNLNVTNDNEARTLLGISDYYDKIYDSNEFNQLTNNLLTVGSKEKQIARSISAVSLK